MLGARGCDTRSQPIHARRIDRHPSDLGRANRAPTTVRHPPGEPRLGEDASPYRQANARVSIRGRVTGQPASAHDVAGGLRIFPGRAGRPVGVGLERRFARYTDCTDGGINPWYPYYYPSTSSHFGKVSLWPETVSTVGAKTIPRRLRPRVATSRDQRATYPLSASLRDLRVNSLSLSVAAEPR